MTLSEARDIIHDPAAPRAQKLEASAVIAGSKKSELGDLIRCLRLGGNPAEIAATALYTRTGRPFSGKVSEFSSDAEEWSRYLATQLEAASK